MWTRKISPAAREIDVRAILRGPLGKEIHTRLILDTGSPFTILDIAFARTIGLTKKLSEGRSRLLSPTGPDNGYKRLQGAPRLAGLHGRRTPRCSRTLPPPQHGGEGLRRDRSGHPPPRAVGLRHAGGLRGVHLEEGLRAGWAFSAAAGEGSGLMPLLMPPDLVDPDLMQVPATTRAARGTGLEWPPERPSARQTRQT